MTNPKHCAARAVSGWPRVLFYLIQFTWGLPVNLVGLILFLCFRGRFRSERFCNGIATCLPRLAGGFSLGIFLFIGAAGTADSPGLCAHEYGHTVQCLLLGPLYWLVVALPSVIWCHGFSNYRRKHGIAYDALYCERWATAWGRTWSGL